MRQGSQLQLWQFLIELLCNPTKRHIIQWVDDAGTFRLLDHEKVAEMWGERKGKPTMNYEKMSRAMR